MKNVISKILELSSATQTETRAHVEEQKKEIDAVHFLHETEGYMGPKDFLQFVTQLKRSELEGLEQFLSDISNGIRIKTSPFPLTDKAGKKYYWIKHSTKTIGYEYKLVISDGLDRLLKDYSTSLYTFNLSLESLFEHSAVIK